MNKRSIKGLALALMLVGGLTLTACSDSTEPPVPEPETGSAEGYPKVPKPTGPDDFDQPDESERNGVTVSILGKNVDFAPTWSQGVFTWDIDIQTHYETLTALGWQNKVDPPGNYYSGTARNTALRFEGGVVDLRNPYPQMAYLLHDPVPSRKPMPRRLIFVEGGEILAEPYNPKVNASECYFNFGPDYGTHEVTFNPGIFVGVWDLDVEAGFNQRNKKRLYHVAATAAPKLTNAVFIKRERYWKRVLVDGVKSVRADPGTSKTVTYTSTHGTKMSVSSTFAETTEVGASISPFDVGVSLNETTERTFGRTSEIAEEESVAVSHQLTGIEGKTVIFSVWESVERYIFVDENGDPYTDPGYTFTDLGDLVIRGDHQILQSAAFDLE